MNKTNLETGMWVKIRDGRIFLVLDDIITSEDCFMHLDEYKKDLCNIDLCKREYDIMEIYSGSYFLKNKGKLLWNRNYRLIKVNIATNVNDESVEKLYEFFEETFTELKNKLNTDALNITIELPE